MADAELTFNIGPDQAGIRLDAYLASQIEGWSRARLQRLIENEDFHSRLIQLRPLSHNRQRNIPHR